MVLMVGSLVVALLVLFWLWSILKTTFQTALLVAIVVFALQWLTGLGPLEVMGAIRQQIVDQFIERKPDRPPESGKSLRFGREYPVVF
ncbi:MAG TPA: hypothetical protein DCQ32_07275 [Cyanobacteria bacterium UBA8156]|jgi:hypothetical protein|nr:hypothetical protein [Cyanobacteria bacterium UBA8156]